MPEQIDLHHPFGNPKYSDEELASVFRSLGFGEILANYTVEQIIEGQRIMRELTVAQITKERVEGHLKIRKMTKK